MKGSKNGETNGITKSNLWSNSEVKCDIWKSETHWPTGRQHASAMEKATHEMSLDPVANPTKLDWKMCEINMKIMG